MAKTFFKKFGVLSTALILACTLGLSSCSDDDDKKDATVELKTSTTSIDIIVDEVETVSITAGNGDYTIAELTAESKAIIEVSAIADSKFTVKGIKAGNATVVVKDKAAKEVTITVKVSEKGTGLGATAAGIYTGKLTVNAGTPVTTDNTITLTATGENKISTKLVDFKFGELSLGDIAVTDIVLTGDDKNITVVENTQDVKITLGGTETSVPVTTTGTIKEGQLELSLSIKVASLPAPVVASFVGSKSTASPAE